MKVLKRSNQYFYRHRFLRMCSAVQAHTDSVSFNVTTISIPTHNLQLTQCRQSRNKLQLCKEIRVSVRGKTGSILDYVPPSPSPHTYFHASSYSEYSNMYVCMHECLYVCVCIYVLI